MRRGLSMLLDAVAAPLPDVVAIPLLPLDGGLVTLVSACDFERVVDGAWRPINGYAAAIDRGAAPRYLHRVLTDAPDGMLVDHADGDPLNNTRGNLRVCTISMNRGNSMKNRSRGGAPTLSRYKGVSCNGAARSSPWSAQLCGASLGQYATETDAAHAYDAAAREHFGAFATLNFPRPGERSALREPPTVAA